MEEKKAQAAARRAARAAEKAKQEGESKKKWPTLSARRSGSAADDW